MPGISQMVSRVPVGSVQDLRVQRSGCGLCAGLDLFDPGIRCPVTESKSSLPFTFPALVAAV